MTDIHIDGQTVYVDEKDGNGIRHECWDIEQYERQPNAIGRHPRYVYYTYERKNM